MILGRYNGIFPDASIIQENLLLSSEEFLSISPDYLNVDFHDDHETEYFACRKVELLQKVSLHSFSSMSFWYCGLSCCATESPVVCMCRPCIQWTYEASWNSELACFLKEFGHSFQFLLPWTMNEGSDQVPDMWPPLRQQQNKTQHLVRCCILTNQIHHTIFHESNVVSYLVS